METGTSVPQETQHPLALTKMDLISNLPSLEPPSGADPNLAPYRGTVTAVCGGKGKGPGAHPGEMPSHSEGYQHFLAGARPLLGLSSAFLTLLLPSAPGGTRTLTALAGH